MPIAATQLSASAFTVVTDRTGKFLPGLRVCADCGDDGLRFGSVADASYDSTQGLTTVSLDLDAGSLTTNLTEVAHGNTIPGSMPRASSASFGAVRLATTGEATTGEDPGRVVTPAGLAAAIAARTQYSNGAAGAVTRTVASKLGDVVSIRDFGVVGDGATNWTEQFANALDYCITSGKTLFIPPGTYLMDKYARSGPAMRVAIVGDPVDLPVIRPSQAAVDAGNILFTFSRSRYANVSGLSLAVSILPNQPKIFLNTVDGLSPGMILQVSSDRLWYNGHRYDGVHADDAYYCGEIHMITAVDTLNKSVTLDDFTRDFYATTQTLVIRAWWPNAVTIKNLIFDAPYPALSTTGGSGIALQQCAYALVSNVRAKGFKNSMIIENLCWHSRFRDVYFEQGDDLDTAFANGYGIENNGSVGTVIQGLRSKGLRRAYDAGAIAGKAEASVARDWRVTLSIVRGGGAWWPNTAAINYGIGTHGPSENGVVECSYIQDCSNGITARGRNTTVVNVVFGGSIGTAVRACPANG